MNKKVKNLKEIMYKSMNVTFVIIDDESLKNVINGAEWNDDISNRIKSHMEGLGVTQKEIAKKLNVTQQNVQKHLANRSLLIGNGLFMYLLKYAGALQCTAEYLLGIVDNPTDVVLTPYGCSMWPKSINYLPEDMRRDILNSYDEVVEKWELISPAEKVFCSEFTYEYEPCDSISIDINDVLESNSNPDYVVGSMNGGLYFYKHGSKKVLFKPNGDENLFIIKDPQFHYLIQGNSNDSIFNDTLYDISCIVIMNLLSQGKETFDIIGTVFKTMYELHDKNLDLINFKKACELYSKYYTLFNSFISFCMEKPKAELQKLLIHQMKEDIANEIISKNQKNSIRNEANRKAEIDRENRHAQKEKSKTRKM